MHVLAKRTLRTFWLRQPQARASLETWYAVASAATWRTPTDIKSAFGSNVDFLGDNRVIFDIAGNKYRLVVRVAYSYGRVYVKFVGTHADYDRIDAETI